MRGLLQLALDFLDGPHAGPQPSPPPEVRSVPGATPGFGMASKHAQPGEAVASQSTTTPVGLAFTHPHANRQTRLAEVSVAYEFKRGRRRTIGMAVGESGLTVSAPRWTPLYEVEAVLQEKAAWIVRKLNEMHARRLRTQASRLEWREGTVLPWLGQPLVLRLRQALDQIALAGATDQTAKLLAPASGSQRGRTRRVAKPVLDTEGVTPSGEAARVLRLDLPADVPPAQIRDAVHAWFLEEARALFAQRLDHYAPMLQVQWRKLALSNARTRWGSASSDGRIHLNWRLMHMPLAVIDYVVVHELSHLRVMDHSPRFWETVRSVMPDYERQREQLRDITLPIWSG